MRDVKRKTMILLTVFGMFFSVLGMSYAYFKAKVAGAESTSTVYGVAANLTIEFREGTNQITATDIFPGWYDTKTFKVINNSNTQGEYVLYLFDVTNEFKSESISFEVTSTNSGATVEKMNLPTTDKVLNPRVIISGNTIQEYTVKVYYNNLETSQEEDLGKKFSFKIGIVETNNLKLTVNLNGGQSTQVFNEVYKKEAFVVLNDPTRTNYSFDGWVVTSGDGNILNNLIVNGSFENGMTNWTQRADVSSAEIVNTGGISNSKYVKIVPKENTSNAGHSWAYLSSNDMIIPSGHKVYSSAYYRKSGGGGSNLHIYDLNNSVDILSNGEFSDDKTEWTKVSLYGNNTVSTATNTLIYGAYNTYSSGMYTEWDNVLTVDLTENFGTGNEPTKEWCDENIEYFKTAIKLKQRNTTIAATWKKTEPAVINSFSVSSKNTSYNAQNVNVQMSITDVYGGELSVCLSGTNNITSCNSWGKIDLSANETKTYSTEVDLANLNSANTTGSGNNITIYAFVKNAAFDDDSSIYATSNTTYKLYKYCDTMSNSGTGAWGSCSKACGTGTQTRTVNRVDSYFTSVSCPSTSESQNCNTMDCCSSTTTNYGSYGSCSASCGGGTQSRTITVTSNYDGSVCSTRSESQSCNTQACCTNVTRWRCSVGTVVDPPFIGGNCYAVNPCYCTWNGYYYNASSGYVEFYTECV